MSDIDRRERYRASFRALFEVAKALTENLALDEILRRIAREACNLVQARECSIMLLDQWGERLLTAAAYGLTEEEEKRISFALGEGVAGWVALQKEIARIDDVRRDPRFRIAPNQIADIKSLLAAPLITNRGCIGVISLSRPDHPFDIDDEDLLELLADAIVLDLEIVRLRHLAYKDPLTEAWSRQVMESAIEVLIRGARRDAQPLSVLLFDADHFKQVNDLHGHPYGDFVLKELVARMHAAVRVRDQIFRYGGDEFLILAPGASLRRARSIAERVSDEIADEPFASGTITTRVTASFGVASLRKTDLPDGSSLVARADRELLAAKRGRS